MAQSDLRLPDSKVTQDLFRSAQNGVEFLSTLELLDKAA